MVHRGNARGEPRRTFAFDRDRPFYLRITSRITFRRAAVWIITDPMQSRIAANSIASRTTQKRARTTCWCLAHEIVAFAAPVIHPASRPRDRAGRSARAAIRSARRPALFARHAGLGRGLRGSCRGARHLGGPHVLRNPLYNWVAEGRDQIIQIANTPASRIG